MQYSVAIRQDFGRMSILVYSQDSVQRQKICYLFEGRDNILDESSASLTTFITPFGRYMYKRLPMGINSALEVYSRNMAAVLQDLEGSLFKFNE